MLYELRLLRPLKTWLMMTSLRKKVARATPTSRANRVEGSNTGGQHWPYPSDAEPNRDLLYSSDSDVMLELTETLKYFAERESVIIAAIAGA